MRASAIGLVCGLACMAGCSKSPTNPPAVQAPAGPAFSFGRPQPKLGLWKLTISTDDGPGISFTGEMCIDAQTQRSAFEVSPRARSRNCTEPKFSPNPGGGVVFDGTCKVNDRVITSHGVATGDFSNAYSVDMTTRMDPPLPGGLGGGRSRIDARWAGACKPGQRPGQMTGLHLSGVGRG